MLLEQLGTAPGGHILTSLGRVTRSGSAGSHGDPTLKPLRSCHWFSKWLRATLFFWAGGGLIILTIGVNPNPGVHTILLVKTPEETCPPDGGPCSLESRAAGGVESGEARQSHTGATTRGSGSGLAAGGHSRAARAGLGRGESVEGLGSGRLGRRVRSSPYPRPRGEATPPALPLRLPSN